MPRTNNHFPLPLNPFLPLIIKSPVIASKIRETAKISETHVHNFFGVFKLIKFIFLKTALFFIVSIETTPVFKFAEIVFPSRNISISKGLVLK